MSDKPNPELQKTGLQLYVDSIASSFESKNDYAAVEISPTELLLKFCSEQPDPDTVDRFVSLMNTAGFPLHTRVAGTSIELIYLLEPLRQKE